MEYYFAVDVPRAMYLHVGTAFWRESLRKAVYAHRSEPKSKFAAAIVAEWVRPEPYDDGVSRVCNRVSLEQACDKLHTFLRTASPDVRIMSESEFWMMRYEAGFRARTKHDKLKIVHSVDPWKYLGSWVEDVDPSDQRHADWLSRRH